MVQRMRQVTGDSHSINLDDLDAQLEDAFRKADSSKSGYGSNHHYRSPYDNDFCNPRLDHHYTRNHST